MSKSMARSSSVHRRSQSSFFPTRVHPRSKCRARLTSWYSWFGSSMWKRLPPVMSGPHCRSAIFSCACLGSPLCAVRCASQRGLATTASPAECPCAYVHASGAVLPCPRGRKRYAQDSLKTRLPSQFSDSSAVPRCQFTAAKVDHYTRSAVVTRSLLSTAREPVLFGRWLYAAAA